MGSDAPGGGIALAVGVGPCAAPLDYGAGPALSFAAGEGPLAKSDTTKSVAVPAGQCVALRVDLLGTTTETYLNCTLERLAG